MLHKSENVVSLALGGGHLSTAMSLQHGSRAHLDNASLVRERHILLPRTSLLLQDDARRGRGQRHVDTFQHEAGALELPDAPSGIGGPWVTSDCGNQRGMRVRKRLGVPAVNERMPPLALADQENSARCQSPDWCELVAPSSM